MCRVLLIEDSLFCDFRDNGNEDSFDRLFLLIEPWLFRYIYRNVNDRAEAENIHQDTWEILLKNKRKYNPKKGSVKNLIFTIALNEIRKWQKRNIQNRKPANIQTDETEINMNGIHPETPGSIIENKERSKAITEAVSALDENYRQAVTLYYYSDLKVDKIAETMNKPIGTIKIWLFRARTELEKKLIQYKDGAYYYG
jgi:RNA polymerase sigma-70 factor (ECF subfamily)